MRIKQIGFKKLFILPLMVAFLAFASVALSPATTMAEPNDPNSADGAITSDEDSTCAIDKVGWILCPLIEKAGMIGDQAFQQLSSNFLETEPELVSSVTNTAGNKPGTYTAWELARNIANILFIAAFLIIILSQVTGRGIDNYGIKKLLPKLIIAAIAVNISYFICQLMVDLTNVLGYEIQNFMVHTAAQVSDRVIMPPNNTFTAVDSPNGALGQIGIAAVAVAGLAWFLMPVLFLGISTVVITCLVIIAILLMRKAFIVLLVVASPIAFVAYLLPNTEKYFQKWLSMFWQLLLVFPIVGLLFGGGQLASAIVLVAGTSNQTDAQSRRAAYEYKSGTGSAEEKCIEPAQIDKQGKVSDPNAKILPCGDRSTPLMLGLVAAGIAVAPMLAVWAVLKGALSAAGAIGGKIGGAIQAGGNGINKYARKPEDALRQAASQKYQTRALAGRRTPGGSLVRLRHKMELNKENRESAYEAAKAGNIVANANNLKIAQQNATNKAAAGAVNQEIQRGVSSVGMEEALGAGGASMSRILDLAAAKERAERVSEHEKAYSDESTDELSKKFETAIKEGHKDEARALQNLLFARGNDGMKEYRKHTENLTVTSPGNAGAVMSDLKTNMLSNHGDVMGANKDFAKWAGGDGKSSLNSFTSNSATWEDMTVAKFAGMKHVQQEAAIANMSAAKQTAFVDQLKKSSQYKDSVSDVIRNLHGI